MNDDAYKAALNAIEEHTLLELDSVLRHLVAEVERLRRIEAAALALRDEYEGRDESWVCDDLTLDLFALLKRGES